MGTAAVEMRHNSAQSELGKMFSFSVWGPTDELLRLFTKNSETVVGKTSNSSVLLMAYASMAPEGALIECPVVSIAFHPSPVFYICFPT